MSLNIGSIITLPAGWPIGAGKLRHDTAVTIDRIDTSSEGTLMYGVRWKDPKTKRDRTSWIGHDEALKLSRKLEEVQMPHKTSKNAEAAGKQYAEIQIQSDYFGDWVRDQLAEAARMPPSDVLPLEDKHDAKIIAKNMLQQLEWDTKKEMSDGEMKYLIGNVTPSKHDAFYVGFKKACDAARDGLADELLQIKGEIGGGGVGETQRVAERMYHVVAINERTGKKEYLTATPVTHQEAVTILRKQRPHKDVRKQLEPAEARGVGETRTVNAKNRYGNPHPKYRPGKLYKSLKVDRVVPSHNAHRVEFNDGFSVQVHSGSGRDDILYAMRPYDMRLEQRAPGPESRRDYQYAALKAVLDGKPADFVVDHDGDVQARLTDVVHESGVRASDDTVDDPEYIIQGLYDDGTLSGSIAEHGYDDEKVAIRNAQKIARSNWFEGDYVRVITRDGELVWSSKKGVDEVRAPKVRAAGKQATKPGKHGTLKLWKITYKDSDNPTFGEDSFRKWAYNKEHILDQFGEGQEESWEIVKIEPVLDTGPERLSRESHQIAERPWVPPSFSSEGITPIMLECLLYGMGEHGSGKVPRPNDSVVYDREGYIPLEKGGYIVLKRKTPGLSSFGDYYVLTDKGADLERRYRLEVRKIGTPSRPKAQGSQRRA